MRFIFLILLFGKLMTSYQNNQLQIQDQFMWERKVRCLLVNG
ncbi:hypothetical protein GLYMA_15G143166v4 [Glycine max]|nr:hypothetical protein GLYMA_15G143166v4 [Glycine max]KAH1147148.1 hypothetical protein GYH30_042356 [Glycine max]